MPGENHKLFLQCKGSGSRQRCGVTADDHGRLDGHMCRVDVVEGLPQLCIDEDDARLGVPQLVLKKRALQLGIDGHEDRSAFVRGDHAENEFHAILDECQHPIARSVGRYACRTL